MNILSIDTSTSICSVALGIDGKAVFTLTSDDGANHASVLPVYAKEILHKLDEKKLTLDAVAVSAGPGSYTGLRIGVSLAKGYCYGSGAKLIAIDTPLIVANSILAQLSQQQEHTRSDERDKDVLICPMIDARRMEVYTSLYDCRLNQQTPVEAAVINSESYKSELAAHKIYFGGNGAMKCKGVIQSDNAIFVEASPNAQYMCQLAERYYSLAKEGERSFEDIAYYTPFYLKEYEAKHSEVKGLKK